LLGTEGFVEEAAACFGVVSSPLAPAHWEAELTNVMWMAVRTKVLDASEGAARLGLARRLGIESVATATLCQPALLRSVATGMPAYDTLFVELAARTGCPLVTFDTGLLRAFPEIAIRPAQLADL
ncbi:MAG: type II toxin-antitoxin system VapC family toxin, partial [Vicinamibacterales bacterium]